MRVLRWLTDWPAPLFLICIGSLCVLWSTGLLDEEPDPSWPGPYASTFGNSFWDSIWLGAVPGCLLILVGVLRLRMTFRRRDRDWL